MNPLAASTPHALATRFKTQPTLFVPDAATAERFMGFFAAHIRNHNTRRAYYRAICAFSTWCEINGIDMLTNVKPLRVAACIEQFTFAKPTIKQHLAAIRMLFDWLVVGNIITSHPAHSVRGPRYVVTKGRTPILEHDEASTLLTSIDTTTLIGLRDRALIGVMIYTFARIGAVLQMNIEDYYTQGRCGWIRLHEKGGKEHIAPCVAKLEVYLDEYLAASGIVGQNALPFFRTNGRKSGFAHRLTQQDAFRMIQRRVKQVGINTHIGNHSLRATSITAYLKHDGTLEYAQ